jgi:hypothetical protein
VVESTQPTQWLNLLNLQINKANRETFIYSIFALVAFFRLFAN